MNDTEWLEELLKKLLNPPRDDQPLCAITAEIAHKTNATTPLQLNPKK